MTNRWINKLKHLIIPAVMLTAPIVHNTPANATEPECEITADTFVNGIASPRPWCANTKGQWAIVFLGELGAFATRERVAAVVAWIDAEGTTSAWNPLATTLRTADSAGSTNSHGVQAYRTMMGGVAADVRTMNGYKAARQALIDGNIAAFQNAPGWNRYCTCDKYPARLRALYAPEDLGRMNERLRAARPYGLPDKPVPPPTTVPPTTVPSTTTIDTVAPLGATQPLVGPMGLAEPLTAATSAPNGPSGLRLGWTIGMAIAALGVAFLGVWWLGGGYLRRGLVATVWGATLLQLAMHYAQWPIEQHVQTLFANTWDYLNPAIWIVPLIAIPTIGVMLAIMPRPTARQTISDAAILGLATLALLPRRQIAAATVGISILLASNYAGTAMLIAVVLATSVSYLIGHIETRWQPQTT